MAKLLITVEVPSVDEETLKRMIMGDELCSESIFGDALYGFNYEVRVTNTEGAFLAAEEAINAPR